MASNVTLRPANLKDVDSIVALGRDIFTRTFGYSVTAEQLESFLAGSYSPGPIAEDINNPDKTFLLAVDAHDTVLGFALLTRGSTEPCLAQYSNYIELQRLYVGIEQHGKGIGRLLADRCHDMARQQGFKHIWLGVWEDNARGIKVYEKLGYSRIGEHVFDIGGDEQTDHIMIMLL